MKICMICLHVQKKIADDNEDLSQFYDEISDYQLPTEVVYCTECEIQLKQFHKFRKQCLSSMEIYLKWIRSKKTERVSSRNLHKLVPGWDETQNVVTKVEPETGSEEISENIVIGSTTTQIKTEKADDDITISDIMQDDYLIIVKNDEDNEKGTKRKLEIDEDNNENYVQTKIEDVVVEESSVNNIQIKCKEDVSDTPVNNDDTTGMEVEKVDEDTNFLGDDENLDDEVVVVVEMIDEELLKPSEAMDAESDDQTDEDDEEDDDDVEMLLKTICPRKRQTTFDFDQIRSDLKVRLDKMGKILAKDGKPIEAELILSSLEDRCTYRDLIGFQDATNMTSKKLMETIHNFYKRYEEDEKYKKVFDKVYLNTYAKKVDEFEKRKTYPYYVNAHFKCDICFYRFKSIKYLENHIKEYHEETPENTGVICPICKMRLGEMKKNKIRVKAHLETHSAVFKCKRCPLITYFKTTMMSHFDVHEGIMHKCNICEEEFKWSSAYFSHMSKYHSEKKKHICTICGRGFPSLNALSFHLNRHKRDPRPPPEDEERVSCVQCDVSFPSQAVYAAHVLDVHESPSFAKTDSYGLPKRQRKYPVKRQESEKGVYRLVKCKLCNKSNPGAAWLKSHFSKAHPNEDYNLVYSESKNHMCDICGAKFATLYTLQHHVSLHTGERPFPCDLCPKKFRSRMACLGHRAVHFPPTNQCEKCAKKFVSRSNLFNHMKTHIGKKEHKCNFCGKAFIHAANMHQHVQGVHFNIQRVRRQKTTPAESTGEE